MYSYLHSKVVACQRNETPRIKYCAIKIQGLIRDSNSDDLLATAAVINPVPSIIYICLEQLAFLLLIELPVRSLQANFSFWRLISHSFEQGGSNSMKSPM